jgi:VanZ family protein
VSRIIGLWGPVAAFMGLLFFLSAQSSLPGATNLSDKLLHAVAYLVLGTLSLRAAHGGLGELRVWPTLLGLLLTLVYGVVDEWHQAWVPGRHSSGLDFLADAVGAGLSVPVAGLLGGLGRNRARRLGKQG